MRILSFFLIVVILHSCTEAKQKSEVDKKNIRPKIINQKNLVIRKVDDLRFRRSYADRQFRKMSDGEYERIKRSNPGGYSNYDTSLLKKFREIGLLDKNYDLFLKKFKSLKIVDFDHQNVSFQIQDSIQNKLNCEFRRVDKTSKYTLSVSDGLLNSKIDVDGFYMADLKFMLLDIVPGGYREVVILNDYYIMNGDNSDIFIYEIKYN